MEGNYEEVRCLDCENEQLVYGKVSSSVMCRVCGSTVARPTGGVTEFEGEVIDE